MSGALAAAAAAAGGAGAPVKRLVVGLARAGGVDVGHRIEAVLGESVDVGRGESHCDLLLLIALLLRVLRLQGARRAADWVSKRVQIDKARRREQSSALPPPRARAAAARGPPLLSSTDRAHHATHQPAFGA